LDNIAFNISPFAVTVAHVALRSEVDGEDTITPEDVGAECGQTRVPAVVSGLGDEVRLEELDARRRQFNRLSQIDRNQTVHTHEAHRGVLQDIDGGIITIVSNDIAQSERMYVFVFRVSLLCL